MEHAATPEFPQNGQFCPRFQRAMELVGKRWTGTIIRMLIGGPCRFNELLSRVTGISDRLLSERLRELESVGIVKREVRPGPPVRVSYELTCSGHELEPVISALEAWAGKWIMLGPPEAVLPAGMVDSKPAGIVGR